MKFYLTVIVAVVINTYIALRIFDQFGFLVLSVWFILVGSVITAVLKVHNSLEPKKPENEDSNSTDTSNVEKRKRLRETFRRKK